MSKFDFRFDLTDGELSALMNNEDVPMNITADGTLTPTENLYSFGVTTDGALDAVDRIAPPTNNPLAKLWVGKATIYEYQDVTDPITKQTTQQEVPVLINEPCRLSFSKEQSTDIQSGAAVVSQSTVLFIRPDLTIKPGSVIEITQHGVTTKYKGSSKPLVYCNHQEITLELYDHEA